MELHLTPLLYAQIWRSLNRHRHKGGSRSNPAETNQHKEQMASLFGVAAYLKCCPEQWPSESATHQSIGLKLAHLLTTHPLLTAPPVDQCAAVDNCLHIPHHHTVTNAPTCVSVTNDKQFVHTGSIASRLQCAVRCVVNGRLEPDYVGLVAIRSFLRIGRSLHKLNLSVGTQLCDHQMTGPMISLTDVFRVGPARIQRTCIKRKFVDADNSHAGGVHLMADQNKQQKSGKQNSVECDEQCRQDTHIPPDIPCALKTCVDTKLLPFLQTLCEVEPRVTCMTPASCTVDDILNAIRTIQVREHDHVTAIHRLRQTANQRSGTGGTTLPLNQKAGLHNKTYRTMVVVNKLVDRGMLPACCRLTIRVVRAHLAPHSVLRGSDRHSCREYFDSVELEALQKACQTHRDRLLFLLCTRVALRAGALAQLRLDSLVKMETVTRNGRCVTTFKPRHDEFVKTWDKNATRVFTLDDDISEALCAYLQFEHPDIADGAPLPTLLFFGGPRRTAATSSSMNRWVHQLAHRANINRNHRVDVVVGIHAFRRTLVQQLVAHGNSIHQCAAFMGHKSHRTTTQFYFLPSQAHLQETMRLPWHRTHAPPHNNSGSAGMTHAQMQHALRMLSTEQRAKLRELMNDI